METFDFPFHTASAPRYPKGDSFKFGRGYEFSAAPQLPLQRRFTLWFETMLWPVGDTSPEPELDLKRLLDFYEEHLSHKAFLYEHPVYGNLTVKFAADAPLEIPRAIKGGTGAVEAFEITLVEQPL